METTPKMLGFLLLLWITSSGKASPNFSKKNEVSSSKNVAGIASQVITQALINGQADVSANYVFSPLGYATILSILGQGSKGQTRKEIFDALELPENVDEIRNAFRSALTEYSGNDSIIAPQFKTWFYIYRNNTAEDDFRKVLVEDFLVEVRDIDRFDYDFDSAKTAEKNYESEDQKITPNSKDVFQFDDLKKTEPIDDLGTISGFDTLKNEQTNDQTNDYDQLDLNEKQKVSKFDRHVDDDQYVEVPEIKKEIMEDKAEKEHLKKKLQKETEGPEKISLPFKKYLDDSMEIMDAQENRNFIKRFGRAQPLPMSGDVTSALSGNSIVGRKIVDEPSSTQTEADLESKMLLFNGLFFRGNWAVPFMELRNDETRQFNAPTQKQDIKFMMTHGNFKYAEIPEENLVAIELPYKNERYSLLVVIPNTENDLKQFSKKPSYNSINELLAFLEPTDMQLYMPKFRFECTSRAEKALGKLGLTTLFTSKADLSGVTRDAVNYQIQELVQHVAFRIDEGSSTENALSAGNIESRKNVKGSELSIDKPFLFYVRDVIDDIVLVAGKIVEIPVEPEIPLSFN